MLDFYKTSGGRRFVDGTMPRVATTLERIADSLGKLVIQGEKEHRDKAADAYFAGQEEATLSAFEVEKALATGRLEGLLQKAKTAEKFRTPQVGDMLLTADQYRMLKKLILQAKRARDTLYGDGYQSIADALSDAIDDIIKE